MSISLSSFPSIPSATQSHGQPPFFHTSLNRYAVVLKLQFCPQCTLVSSILYKLPAMVIPQITSNRRMGSHSIILWVKYQSPLKPLSQSNYSIFIFLSCLQSPFSPYPGWGNTPSSVQGLLLALYTEINSSRPVWSVRDRNQVSYMQSKYLRSCNLSSTKTGFLILVYSYWT